MSNRSTTVLETDSRAAACECLDNCPDNRLGRSPGQSLVPTPAPEPVLLSPIESRIRALLAEPPTVLTPPEEGEPRIVRRLRALLEARGSVTATAPAPEMAGHDVFTLGEYHWPRLVRDVLRKVKFVAQVEAANMRRVKRFRSPTELTPPAEGECLENRWFGARWGRVPLPQTGSAPEESLVPNPSAEPVLYLDEVSMVGRAALAQLNERLRELSPSARSG